MQDLQDRTIAELEGTHFDLSEPVKRIEALIAPPGGALAMYYTGPSEDFSRPGRTWYPTGGKTRFPLWREVSIAYHEGVPGHHFQIATTKSLSDELSRYQRLIAGTSGYSEGWALYAERLMGELGYLDNPDYYMGNARRTGPQVRPRDNRHRNAPGAVHPCRRRVPPRRAVEPRPRQRDDERLRPLSEGVHRQRNRPLPRACPARRSATKSASESGWRPGDAPRNPRDPPSTSRTGTTRPSASAQWASPKCNAKWQVPDEKALRRGQPTDRPTSASRRAMTKKLSQNTLLRVTPHVG